MFFLKTLVYQTLLSAKELPKGKINLMEDSDSEEEGQAFYAGGSTSSGQQVRTYTLKREGVEGNQPLS